jgi:hypothetical protein
MLRRILKAIAFIHLITKINKTVSWLPPIKSKNVVESFKHVSPVDGDFYFDGPLMVFTEQYHLKRGKCCGSNCRHCPYDKKKNSVKDCNSK